MGDAKARFKGGVKAVLGRVGLDVRRSGGHPGTMAGALKRWSMSHAVRTVIDVGASDGSWSRLAFPAFADASYLLVEAQAGPHEEALRRLAEADHRVQYVIAAAGDSEGTVSFTSSPDDPFGGAVSRGAEDDGTGVVVPMTTLDSEIARRDLQPPFLIKLDTHGFEVPIFEGAAAALAETSLLVVEAYNFELTPGSLRFHELCAYLEDRGLRCIDLVDVMRRPGDGALWQCDLFFVPSDAPEFDSATYR